MQGSKTGAEWVESTLTSSQNQTGITTKLQNNQLNSHLNEDQLTEVLWRRSYRRSHIKTGRDAKRAGLALMCSSWESGEISQLQRSSLRSEGSQSHARLPNRSTKAKRRSTHNCESQWGFCLPGEMPVRNPDALLKGQCTKFHFGSLTLDSGERKADWSDAGRDWVAWL